MRLSEQVCWEEDAASDAEESVSARMSMPQGLSACGHLQVHGQRADLSRATAGWGGVECFLKLYMALKLYTARARRGTGRLAGVIVTLRMAGDDWLVLARLLLSASAGEDWLLLAACHAQGFGAPFRV